GWLSTSPAAVVTANANALWIMVISLGDRCRNWCFPWIAGRMGACDNLAALVRKVPAEFREISGKSVARNDMATDREFAFGSFRFDARSGQLWRERSQVKLTPRAAAVLCYLAERAQELVTKQDLIERVWSGMAVGDDALTSCIQELRGALGDNARRPRFIETLHRRGYRFMVQARLIDRCSDSD